MKNLPHEHSQRETQMQSLIYPSTARRSFGFDTTQYAIGKLPVPQDEREAGHEFGLQLSRNEYTRIGKNLILACDQYAKDNRPYILSSRVNGSRIRYAITAKRVSPSRLADATPRGGADVRELDDVIEFELMVKCSNGRDTYVQIRLQRDRNQNYWLNVRANPSALINGYNAYAVASKIESRERRGHSL